jgi:hypothetical protein
MEEGQPHRVGRRAGKAKLKPLVPMLALLLLTPWVLGKTGASQTAPKKASVPAPKGKDSCVQCHTQMGDQLAAPVAAMQNDIHRQHGLSCADCHGGDPSQDDPELAMNARKGFVAKPAPKAIPGFCGKCHSNAEFMKTFNPAMRVDQEAEYATSLHGKLIKQGDTKPATCISCHGFHGVRAVSDNNAPVYPTNVAQTCGQCHANADYMRTYAIPTDQLQKYMGSVHAEALIKKQDLSAPTCNDCHGNHGAAPPGVASVANVCGTCHSRQSELFQQSPHKTPFEAAKLAACVVCHSNHEIRTPSDDMLGSGENSKCMTCHTQGDAGHQAAERMHGLMEQLTRQIDEAQVVLDRAVRAGMEVSRPLFELKDARDKLINARVVIHGFSPELFGAAVNPGLEVAKKTNRAGLDALAELQFRRKGLAASLIVISLALSAIYLKIRQIEGRNRGRSE